MAIRKFDRKGYGQLEPSQVWFTRAGMSESQCELDPKLFAAHFPALPEEVADGKIYAEVGAFLMIDKERKIATIPTKTLSDLGFQMGINYSTEKVYNQYTPGRRNFCQICGEALPRIGFIQPGMRICTNTVSWDDTVFTVDSTSTLSPSVQMYNAVKTRLAGMKDSTSGRGEAGYTGNNAPIYAVVTNGSAGELVIGADPADAIGNVYAVVTEAYFNADNTLAFKLLFVNKPE